MLTEKHIKEIREHLEKAQNPLFFFDNDADGLASFLLLRRYIDRGKGVAIKSFPSLNASYARKLYELKPDYVFILDKPAVADGFFEEAKALNLPVVWIDHHNVSIDLSGEEKQNVFYYNGFLDDGENEPVSYLCYKIINKKEDLWLAVIGCIGDWFFPDFIKQFEKQYEDLWQADTNNAAQALYTTDIGKITKILSFALKDRTSKVVTMLKFLISSKSPYDILDETKARAILQRFKQVNMKYLRLLDKAKSFARGNLLFFQYGGELSLSADIANELSFLYPDKMIVVAYIKGSKANISLRWKDDIRKLTLEAIKSIEGATGGGHEHATGAQMNVEDLPKFRENLMKMIN